MLDTVKFEDIENFCSEENREDYGEDLREVFETYTDADNTAYIVQDLQQYIK